VDDFPIAVTLGEITPRNAHFISVKNRFDDYLPPCADMAFPARKKILDPLPMVVA
jgi:hypothetical protein